jgi:O-antigen/teichoic acid export membrane protein
MSESKQKKYAKNIVFSIFSKVIIFILGIIIPRMIILNYGSESNGLLSSVGDIYKYIELIEAGIGTAALQALYKPLSGNRKEDVSSVLVATRQFFRRLIKWYALAVVAFSIVYPLVINHDFSNITVFGVIFIQGISHILTYYFVSTLTQLLSADGKEYVSQLVSLIIFVLNSAIKIFLLSLHVNLVVLQCGYLIVNIIQIAIVYGYVRKHYPWINWKAEPNNQALAKKNRYALNGVSWVVFSATDTILITIACGLKEASIYSVYNLVFSNLNTLILVFYTGTYFIIGQKFHEDRENFIGVYDGIESGLTCLSFGLFSVAYVLILPFVTLYTVGADIQYADKYLPLLFTVVQLLSMSRMLSNHIINTANQPQLINRDSLIDVSINLGLSVILVFWIGIYGVLIGTIAALLYRIVRLVYVANRKILNRSPWKIYRNYLINFALFACVVIFNCFIQPSITSYVGFVVYGAMYTGVILSIFALVNIVINPHVLGLVKNLINQKKENK